MYLRYVEALVELSATPTLTLRSGCGRSAPLSSVKTTLYDTSSAFCMQLPTSAPLPKEVGSTSKATLRPASRSRTAAARALKCHGGGPDVTPGAPLAPQYKQENLELLAKGVCNMQHHIRNAQKFGLHVVVAVNRFSTDAPGELDAVIKAATQAGAFRAVTEVVEVVDEGGHDVIVRLLALVRI